MVGKNPAQVEGYAHATINNSARRLDAFYRWVWNEFDGYTTAIAPDHADAYMREIARRNEGNHSRSNAGSSLKRLFKWQNHERGGRLRDPETESQASHVATRTGC